MSGVVLLAVNDFPPLVGGEATLYHALARHLPARDTLVLAPRLSGDGAVDAALRVEVVRRFLPAHRGTASRIARAACGALHLAALLRRRRVRYVLCGQLLSLGVPVRLLAGLRGVPYALFVHGADLSDYHARALWGRLARFAVSGAEAVIANSRFTAGLLERLLPGAARRVVVLPMGVDPPLPVTPGEVETLRRRYRLGGGPVLLTVARLVPMKGHDVVLEALPRLVPRFPALRYVVVGDGPARPRLEALARERGVREAVVFAGAVQTEELPAHYRLATLYVQLSRTPRGRCGLEGFGLSFLEAAGYGLPSIAGRSGGVPEAVADGESGLLVPPEDAAAFAAAALRLLEDDTGRERMARAARRWAAAHSWDAAARCVRSLLPAA